MKKRILVACMCLSIILTCVSCTTILEQGSKKDSEKHPEKDSGISIKWISTEKNYKNISLTPFSEYGEVKINASEDLYTYKCGIADADGNIIVPIIYDDAFPFSDGQYFVQTQNEKKVINTTGEQLFDLSKYDTVDLLTDGFSIVTLNGKEGLITESGKEILPCEYTDVQYNLYLIWAEKDGVWSFFDRNGMLKSDAVYDKIECLRNFWGNGHYYEFNELFKVLKNGKYGVADKEGKEIFPCTYSDLEICDNDVVAVFDGGWKYININDNSSYYIGGYPEKFSEGLALFYSDGKYGYINKKWELVIPCKYNVASAFSGGIANVKEKGPEDFGYLIDKTGKTVVEEKGYEIAVKGEGLVGIHYPNGTAYVRFGPPESIEAVLDESGNPLTEFIYKGVTDFKNGLAVAYKDESGIGLKGLISKSGEEITPFIYENIEFVCDNKYVVIMYDYNTGIEKVGIFTVPKKALISFDD